MLEEQLPDALLVVTTEVELILEPKVGVPEEVRELPLTDLLLFLLLNPVLFFELLEDIFVRDLALLLELDTSRALDRSLVLELRLGR